MFTQVPITDLEKILFAPMKELKPIQSESKSLEYFSDLLLKKMQQANVETQPEIINENKKEENPNEHLDTQKSVTLPKIEDINENTEIPEKHDYREDNPEDMVNQRITEQREAEEEPIIQQREMVQEEIPQQREAEEEPIPQQREAEEEPIPQQKEEENYEPPAPIVPSRPKIDTLISNHKLTITADDVEDPDVKKLLSVINDPLNAWEKKKDTKDKRGMIFGCKDHNDGKMMLKGDSYVDYPKNVVLKALTDLKINKQWDKGSCDLTTVGQIEDRGDYLYEMRHYYMKFPWPMTDRDFMIGRKIFDNFLGDERFALIQGNSITHSAFKEDEKKFVRAEFLVSGIVLEDTPDGKCKIFLITKADVKVGSSVQGTVDKKSPDSMKGFFENIITGCELAKKQI